MKQERGRQTAKAVADRFSWESFLTSTGLQLRDLVLPVFVSDKPKTNTDSIPGVMVSSVDNIVSTIEVAATYGISKVILFGIPKARDEAGSGAFGNDGIIQHSLRSIRSSFGDRITVISDVCVCQYNRSGHCGAVRANGSIDNDKSLQILAKIATSHAEAGADVIAPSSMMDGQVLAIRSELESKGFADKEILSYSAKHSSALYAPFRSTAYYDDSRKFGVDKSSYQVSYANPRQTMREIAEDIAEGADMVMIKPALWYLDLVAEAKSRFQIPIVVQNVSGEYAMIKAASLDGFVDEAEWRAISVAAMKRAGADLIITYFALDIAKQLCK